MNITMLDMYLITRLDNLNNIIVILVVISITVASLVIAGYFIERIDVNENDPLFKKKHIAIVCGIAFVMSLLMAAVPTANQFAAIYLIPKIANNESVQHIPDKALKVLKGKLDEWIDEQMKSKR